MLFEHPALFYPAAKNLLFFFQSVYLAEAARCAVVERAGFVATEGFLGVFLVLFALCQVGSPGLVFPGLSLPGQGVNASYGMITRQPVPQFPRCEMGLTAFPSRGSNRIPQLQHLHHSRTGHPSISPKKQSPNQIPAWPLGTERGWEG